MTDLANEINRQYYGGYAGAGAAATLAAIPYLMSKSGSKSRGPRDLAGYPLNNSYIKGKKGKKKGKNKGRSKRTVKSELDSLKGKIRKLKQMDDATTGTLTYRKVDVASHTSNVNEQVAFNYSVNATTGIETALSYLKYYNPSVPATLTTAAGTAGSYQRNILIDYSSITMTIRNNYQVPCEIDAYLCTTKEDTSQSPVSSWNSATPDGSNLTDSTNLNHFPSDYNLFNDLWKTKKMESRLLQSGQQMTLSHNADSYEYDSATVDTHALTFQKEYKCAFIMIVLKGVLGHDTILDQQCVMPAGVDIEVKRVYKVKYSAGINISYSQVDNTYDAISNSSVVSNKPVSDNQSYSQN